MHASCSDLNIKEFAHPTITLPEGFTRYSPGDKSGAYHEAGYDAYVTGYCYLKMSLMMTKSEHDGLKNCVNLMKSMFTIRLDRQDTLNAVTSLFVAICEEKEGGKRLQKITNTFEEFGEEARVKQQFNDKDRESYLFFILTELGAKHKVAFNDRVKALSKFGLNPISLDDYTEYRKRKFEKKDSNKYNDY